MSARAFGYSLGDREATRPAELSEVTFLASPAVLRRIAQHLLESADSLERHPQPRFEHAHLRDEWDGWSGDCVDVIVARPE